MKEPKQQHIRHLSREMFFFYLSQVKENNNNSHFDDATLLSPEPPSGLRATINEYVLFSAGSVLVKVSVMKLLFFILTLLEPPSPFQINIQRPLIKNPLPRLSLEQDKQS